MHVPAFDTGHGSFLSILIGCCIICCDWLVVSQYQTSIQKRLNHLELAQMSELAESIVLYISATFLT